MQDLKTLEALKTMMNENYDVKFIGLYPEGSAEERIFNEFAQLNRSKALFLSACFPEAFKELDVTSKVGVVCLKNFDEKKTPMKESFTAENLKKFVHIELLPLLGVIDDTNFVRYIDANLPILFVFYVKEEDKAQLTTELKRIAEKYRGKFSFAFIDGFKYSGHAESLGLKTESFPAIAIQDFITLNKYPLAPKEKITATAVDEFIQGIANGKTKGYFVSGPVPAPESNNGPVKVVVHDNFKDLILNEESDALIEMYTTWCHSCKRFASVYEQLGEAYQKNDDKLVLGKMDLEANDQPTGLNLKINTIPALFLFPAGKKNSPIRYQGDYSLASLKEFISENCTHQHEALPEQPIESEFVEEHEDL